MTEQHRYRLRDDERGVSIHVLYDPGRFVTLSKMYDTPNGAVDAYAVGFGIQEMFWVVEQLMNIVAHEAGGTDVDD